MFKVGFSVTACLLSASLAHAACTNPVGDLANTFYNTTVNAVQFCDGTDWYNTGLIVPTATGTSCTTPTGPEGSMFYNTTQNTVQFCNGDGWVNMGTMRFPSATGTSCTTPTGPEGSMFFNTTTGTMQFCNGDDWVNATYLYIAADAITGVEIAKIQASDVDSSDQFGHAVSISGDYAVSGAPTEGTGAQNAGSVYIFKRSGSDWLEEAKIQASDKEYDDRFGYSVSIDGDYAIIGAYREDTGANNAGAAYIFKRTGTSWAQEVKIQASDKQTNDQFGISVSIDGDYAIVGAPLKDSGGSDAGAAYVFKRTGSSWVQETKIHASDSQADDQFGSSVSINGDYSIVGANQEDTGGSEAGAAYIFKRSGSSWTEQSKIQALDKKSGDRFGFPVSIEGSYAIVGAHLEGSGYAGAAYIFKRTSTSWAQEAKIQASDAEDNDSFGISVSISGSHAIVAAYHEDSAGANAGAAYIFERTGTSWAEKFKIQSSDIETGDRFGNAVAINNGKIIIGSSYEDTGGSAAGAAYIFD